MDATGPIAKVLAIGRWMVLACSPAWSKRNVYYIRATYWDSVSKVLCALIVKKGSIICKNLLILKIKIGYAPVKTPT